MKGAFHVFVHREGEGVPLISPYTTNIQRNYEYEKKDLSKHEKVIQDFESGKMPEVEFKEEYKELFFMDDIGMTREVARTLDIDMRAKLEKIFPELKRFNIMCFKKKAGTGRRALIFPQENDYLSFMDEMLKFLNDYGSKKIPDLNSRVKINFKGKYIIQIEEDIYKNFKDEIERIFTKFKMSYINKQLIKKREITIVGSHDRIQQIRD